jgi:hypothetical protein
MNCAQCQSANDPGSTFCINCGTSLIPPASAGYVGPTSYETPAPPQYQPGTSGSFVQRSATLPPANFALSRLTTVDRVIAGATLVTMISLWLPWFSASFSGLGATTTGSISGTGYHGWLWLVFILALGLLAYFAAKAAWDQLPFRLPVSDEWLLIGGTGLQLLLIVIGFLAMPPTDGLQGYSVSWDFGAFIALVASITAAAPVIYPAARTFLESRRAGAPRAS